MLGVRHGEKNFESSKNPWSSDSKWSPCWQAGEDGLSYLLSFPHMEEGVEQKREGIVKRLLWRFWAVVSIILINFCPSVKKKGIKACQNGCFHF